MKNQKDNWDILAVDLGLASEPAAKQAAEQEHEKSKAETVLPQVVEEKITKKTITAVAETGIESVTDENDSFGANILDEPVRQQNMKPVEIPKVAADTVFPEKREPKKEADVLTPAVPQETVQNSQREQKKSFLGRFAKMTFFGTPAAKEQPPVRGKNQRHSAKAVTSFASKTVETADVPLNHIIKSENPAVQNVHNTTADIVSAKKGLPVETKRNETENNPRGQLVSQIESRIEDLEHRRGRDTREQRGSGKKEFSRRPPSMFADEPAESKEARALKNLIEDKEIREEAAERLNSIFNGEDVIDEQSYRFTPSPRQKQKQREQRDKREGDSEERGYHKRTHGKRGSKFNQRASFAEEGQEFQEERDDFPSSWEEMEEVKPAERLPERRGSRGSRSEYKQSSQERQFFQKREKRVISGHFNNDADEFILDDEDEIISVDPVLVQAAKTALGWDDAVSDIIEGNIRRHQSGNGNYRQNRR